jgi:hypothetical protein
MKSVRVVGLEYVTGTYLGGGGRFRLPDYCMSQTTTQKILRMLKGFCTKSNWTSLTLSCTVFRIATKCGLVGDLAKFRTNRVLFNAADSSNCLA